MGTVLPDMPDDSADRAPSEAATARHGPAVLGPSLGPIRENSTKPIAETRTHAGIVKVKRYGLDVR
jgi:hypothetical protein